ncbi:hypothetical protein MRX96_014735 [Rhipicephalus microplus]
MFRAVGMPSSRFESSSKRGLGRLARALLQVDSVSVHYRNRATVEVGPFRHLLQGYKPLERTRPPGYLRFQNAGRNVGRCQSPVFPHRHQSLRPLVTIAFLLVVFVLISGLFATKRGENFTRRNKDTAMKHIWFADSVCDNLTGVDARREVRQEYKNNDENTHKRKLVLEVVLPSSGTATSVGWSPVNSTEKDAS